MLAGSQQQDSDGTTLALSICTAVECSGVVQELPATTSQPLVPRLSRTAGGPQSSPSLASPSKSDVSNIWERHRGVFIALIAISAVCLGAIAYFVRTASMQLEKLRMLHAVMLHSAPL